MCGEAQRELEWRLLCTNAASNRPSLWGGGRLKIADLNLEDRKRTQGGKWQT